VDGTNIPHEKLSGEIVVQQPGYAYIYFSNDNGQPLEVFFDDFTVEHAHSAIVQADDYYPFGLTFNEYRRENGLPNRFLYNGKERQDNLDLGWYDYGARMYMPDIGRWTAADPAADVAPSHTPFRYAFNNPLIFIDPDGLYEWRVNSQTGEYERIGDEGGNEEQFIYWDDAEKAAGSLKGETIYVGAVAKDWYSDGEFSYGVHTKDLWSDLPDEYQGAYTAADLKERYKAQQNGGVKYESIKEQEATGLARRDQVWNARDYGRYLDKKYGNRSSLVVAFDTRMLEEMLPNAADIAKGALDLTQGSTGLAKPNKMNDLSRGVGSVANTNKSNNPWIRFLQENKGKYKGLGKNWINQAAADYHKIKK